MKRKICALLAVLMMLVCGSVGVAAEQPEVDGDIIFNVGEQVFEFLRYDISTDYQGNLAIILSFDYTNNSKEPNMAAYDFHVQVFQHGIEKDSCVIDYDSQWGEWDKNLTTEIKDGVTFTVCRAFLLDDTQAPVDVEVSELVNFVDTQEIVIDISRYSESIPETEPETEPTEQIKTFELEYVEMSENYSVLESEYAAVEQEYNSLKNDYDSLISGQSELESKANYDAEAVTEWEQKYNDLSKEEQILQSEKEALESENAVLSDGYETLESENAGFSSDISEWEQKYETLQSENEELKQAVEDLKNEETEITDTTDWQSMYEELSVEYETLQSEYDVLLEENGNFESELEYYKNSDTEKTIENETETSNIPETDEREVENKQIVIQNMNFEIPDVWEYSSESIEDDVTSYYYKTETEILLVRDSRYQTEYNEDTALLYDVLVGVVASGFADNDGYILMSEDNYEIDGHSAQYDLLMCKLNGIMYCFECMSLNTGYSVVDFVYQRYLGDESIGLDSLKEMFKELRIGESQESTDNSETKITMKYTSGNYKVGTDIPAGEYVVFAENGMGYFCVSPDSNQDDITFNDNFEYNSIITVNDGEYLELSSCYAVPFKEEPELNLSGAGMFKVGTHIPAGEYKIESMDSMGYYCIYPDSRQDDIISNDNFEGQKYVTVADGQYLVLSRCKFSEIPIKPVKAYTDTDTVMKAQEALNAAGYGCGTPDGIVGTGTASAVEKYQTDNGFTVTGTITDEVLESLGI